MSEISCHNPLLVALIETKMQDHQSLVDDFPFTRMIQVPAVGNSGGLVILWDNSLIEVDDIATTGQEIHAMVKVCATNEYWLFSCIYASTYLNSRKILWENVKKIKVNYDGKWLIGGDFNELMKSSEKAGVLGYGYYCELIDMGYKGGKYTWLNKRFNNRSSLIFERLDRFFANEEWLHKFPDAQVHHLPRIHSDHCPLLLSVLQNSPRKRNKLFRFESIWTTHTDLRNIVLGSWEGKRTS
ncbi:hypothetical protein R3W88_024144 [Solanum pinnatisectum]|uniref:Endonuclease/exonuclease/phosphatase domain-containing protein n=1 Tax=Solanum pinnatisectum TaxID=50273 RepID=A0AAV9LZI8_9SOLN|nr:hypothetical protein R3W88_024144 [Solanum pinnatisectum]